MQIYGGTNPKKNQNQKIVTYPKKQESCSADLSNGKIPREDEEPRQYARSLRA